jgi:hypothetical protein
MRIPEEVSLAVLRSGRNHARRFETALRLFHAPQCGLSVLSTTFQNKKIQLSQQSASDPPPLKWSDLKYVLGIKRTAMARKRYKPEEIVANLRQVFANRGEGAMIQTKVPRT